MKESTLFNDQNLTEKVHFVYRVIIDGKYYIGKRSGRLDDLHSGAYETSSKLIKEKLKNGKTFSKIKILKVLSTEKEALEYEKKFLTRVNAKSNSKFLNQSNGGNGNYTCKKHTQKSKEKMSEKTKEYFNPETEHGRKNLEKRSQISKAIFDKNTEEGRKRCENQSNKMKEHFNPNTEHGRKNLEENRRRGLEQFNPDTERGRKRRENQSEKLIEFYKTERGMKTKENMSEIKKEFYKTERGIKNRQNHSEFMKENIKIITQKRVETQIQKRKDASILGELMFDEAFIKENFLIIDDKNNLRFLWSVYSKLTGYSGGHICREKREGKLKFLYRIKTISISEEQELTKIKEIEAIIKSRNEELSLKAS